MKGNLRKIVCKRTRKLDVSFRNLFNHLKNTNKK